MGHRYVKKPNGLYAVWSTTEDDFLADDLTFDQLKQYDMVTGIKDAIRQSQSFFKTNDKGESKFLQHLAMNKSDYDELVEFSKGCHGG